MAALRCLVVTPERTVLEADADFIALPLIDGEAGIAPNRGPLIGQLGYGELRLTLNGASTRYYVDGGFVQVVQNVVSVLTQRAQTVESIDAAAAREQLAAAMKKPISTPELAELRERAILQARSLLRLAEKR